MWSVIIFFENVLGCCRRYWSKESIHGECLLILSDNRSNITLWYGTDFFYYLTPLEMRILWNSCNVAYLPALLTGISDLLVLIIFLSILPLVHLLWLVGLVRKYPSYWVCCQWTTDNPHYTTAMLKVDIVLSTNT